MSTERSLPLQGSHQLPLRWGSAALLGIDVVRSTEVQHSQERPADPSDGYKDNYMNGVEVVEVRMSVPIRPG